jgi:hypothetical protein
MKRTFFFILLATMQAQWAVAQEAYFGLGVGQVTADIDRANLPGFSEDIDDQSTAFKLFAGSFIGRNADVELSYVDFGEFSDKLESASDRINLKWEGRAIAASLLGRLPISNQDAFFVRGGVHWWEVDFKVSTEGPTFGTGSASESDDGVDLLLGLGYQHDFGGFGIRAEWERYSNVGSDDTAGDSDLDLLGVSVLAGF